MCKDGTYFAEICIRIVSAMAAMARLNRIWPLNTISFASMLKLYKSVVTSILLYGCETWTLLADSEKKIQAFKTKCLRKLFRVSYVEHKINDCIRSDINSLVDPQKPFLATFIRRKLAWWGMSH